MLRNSQDLTTLQRTSKDRLGLPRAIPGTNKDLQGLPKSNEGLQGLPRANKDLRTNNDLQGLARSNKGRQEPVTTSEDFQGGIKAVKNQ